jgi:CMP-N-acetylneuraminic acid synthetase
MNIKYLITARAGSTLPDKSFQLILDKPCIEYSLEAAQSFKSDDIFCSSDCPRVLEYCAQRNVNLIRRPQSLGQDSSQHIDVLIHAINHIESLETLDKIDIVVVSLPNNPFVTSTMVDECVQILRSDPGLDSVVPVILDNDKHPYRARRIGKDNILSDWMISSISSIQSTNRQDLPRNAFICHNFWVLRRDNIFAAASDSSFGVPPWRFMGNRPYGHEIPFSHDIHTKTDVALINTVFKSHNPLC